MDILDNIYESSTNNIIYGMGNTTIEDIVDFAKYKIEDILYRNDLDDIEIIELNVCGSRINPNPHKDADLDIVLYYKGNIKEKDLYNIIHRDIYVNKLTYDKVYIDIKTEKVKV